jgi:hypothetical protein
MMRRSTPMRLAAPLVAAALALAACEPKPAAASKAFGCTVEEMRTRKARTAACRAEFQALLDRAEADRRRASALPDAEPAPARDRF